MYNNRHEGDRKQQSCESFHWDYTSSVARLSICGEEAGCKRQKSSENGTGEAVETLERFQQTRRVIEDFTTRTLAAIPSDYARLLYVSSLRDLASGCYRHEGLAVVYPEGAVQQALAHCHEELFTKILETPLEGQEWDLRTCLKALEGDFWGMVTRWQELEVYRVLLPSGVPAYLRDLFCSNLRALLGILAEERATWQQAA